MKDNFDIQAWNKERYLGKAPVTKDVTKNDFDLREWNKKRYLGELYIDDERDDQDVSATNVSGNINVDRGGDDAKMGAELESDENVVGEGVNDREIEGKLSDLSYDFLSNYFESERFNAPNPDDSSRTIYSPDQWEDWKSGIMKRFGDVDIKLDNQGYYDDDKFAILDKQFKADKEGYIKSKAAALDRIRQRTNFGLDEAMDASRDKLNQLAMSIGFDEFAKTILMLKDENLLNDIVDAMKMYKVDNVSYYNPDVLKESINLSDYNEDVEKAIDVGIRVGSNFDVEDVMYYVHNNWMAGNLSAEEAMKKISKYISPIRENVAPNHDGKAAPYGSGYEAVKETLRFIKENNPEFTNEEIKAELKEIKELGNQLNEKLCPKGEAYRKRRMAAGEKSSAYLSGRAVKVCKGQMSGKKKKKKK
tara:strand:- start:146 stop:1402 length:1257 start_codon:yes stop_codon:yes gene_type:complete